MVIVTAAPTSPSVAWHLYAEQSQSDQPKGKLTIGARPIIRPLEILVAPDIWDGAASASAKHLRLGRSRTASSSARCSASALLPCRAARCLSASTIRGSRFLTTRLAMTVSRASPEMIDCNDSAYIASGVIIDSMKQPCQEHALGILLGLGRVAERDGFASS